jgi:hypothetical protein
MRVITKARLKDRLRAFAVFTGIAIGGVSGFELVLTGGLDPVTPAAMFAADAPPPAYNRPAQRQDFAYQQTHRPYAPTSFAAAPAPFEVEPVSMRVMDADLVGAPGVEPGSTTQQDGEDLSGAALRAEIDRLFREGAPAPTQEQHAAAGFTAVWPF